MNKFLGLSAAYNDEETLPTFFEYLSKLSPSVPHHVFCTNNCTDKTNEIIDSNDCERISYNLHPDFVKKMDDPYSALAIAWNRLLLRAREIMGEDESYTYAVYLDTDIFILDTNALIKAASWGKDILGGSYVRDFPEGRYLATAFQVNDDVIRYLPQYKSRRGEYIRIDKIFYDLIQPYVTSAGFMLLSRDIIMDKRLRFFPIYKMNQDGVPRKETSPEFGFQNLAKIHGYSVWLDGTVKLSHYIKPRHRSWRSDGERYEDFSYLI